MEAHDEATGPAGKATRGRIASKLAREPSETATLLTMNAKTPGRRAN
jgi:hypothetical protein